MTIDPREYSGPGVRRPPGEPALPEEAMSLDFDAFGVDRSQAYPGQVPGFEEAVGPATSPLTAARSGRQWWRQPVEFRPANYLHG
jgi:hypothetical protein